MKPSLRDMLLDLRASHGWSQERIAEAVEASQPQISRILSGKTTSPRSDLRVRIERVHDRMTGTPEDPLAARVVAAATDDRFRRLLEAAIDLMHKNA